MNSEFEQFEGDSSTSFAPQEGLIARRSAETRGALFWLKSDLAVAALTAAFHLVRSKGATTAHPDLQPSNFIISSSDETATKRQLTKRVAAVLARGANEELREGVDSRLAEDIRLLLMDFGEALFPEIQRSLGSNTLDPDVGFEVLATLAGIDYSSLVSKRRELIEAALLSSEPEIRYGAVLALVTLKDRAGIEPLEAAVARERVPDLKGVFERALARLRE